MTTTTSATLITRLDNPFWRFSISVYQHPAVKKACLSFQEEQHANVNLLLLCCWLAYSVEEISQAELLQACHTIDDWHASVTQPLRTSRCFVKSLINKELWVKDFCQQLLMDEIVSETWQQYLLFTCFEKNKKLPLAKNEQLAITYLHWIFADMNLIIDIRLEAKISNFVNIIFSMVTHHEDKSTHNRD